MAKNTENFDYLAKTEELRQLIDRLQDDKIGLDELLALHERGSKLINEIEQYLEEAKIIIKQHITEEE